MLTEIHLELTGNTRNGISPGLLVMVGRLCAFAAVLLASVASADEALEGRQRLEELRSKLREDSGPTEFVDDVRALLDGFERAPTRPCRIHLRADCRSICGILRIEGLGVTKIAHRRWGFCLHFR